MNFPAFLKAIFISLMFLSLNSVSIGQVEVVSESRYICSTFKGPKNTSNDKRACRTATLSKRKKLNIILPYDYTPPVAKKQDIIFPETNAGTMKQRILRNKRKKNKNKGCTARAF